MKPWLIVLVLMMVVGGPAQTGRAQAASAVALRTEQPGLVVPFGLRMRIDGEFSDWSTIPVETVGDQLEFALAADARHLYIRVDVADSDITMGTAGSAGDALQLYLNYTDEAAPTAYGAGVYEFILPAETLNVEREVTIPLVDVHIIEGVTQVWELPPPAIVRGRNSDALNPIIAATRTDDGWAIEAAFRFPENYAPQPQATFGFNVIYANAAPDAEQSLSWVGSTTPQGAIPPQFGVVALSNPPA